MRILLITIDVTRPQVDTKPLYEAIKAQGTWWHYLKTTWLVHTDKSVQQVADALVPQLKERGRMLICELHRPYQGLLPKDAWDWINSRGDKKVAK